MVIVDHNKNIQRIIDEVLLDSNLFDDGATVGKLRKVIFGNPENDKKLAITPKPALYVTTKDSIQNSRYPFGYVFDDNQKQVTVEYELVLVANSTSKTEKSQTQIYDLLKNLRNLAEGNRRFADTTTNNSPSNVLFWTEILQWDKTTSYSVGDLVFFEGIVYRANSPSVNNQPPSASWDAQISAIWMISDVYSVDNIVVHGGRFYNCIQANTGNDGDPVFARSIINDVRWDSETRGKLTTSISVTLLATIGESFIASFPGIGNILLLSKPNAPQGIVYTDDREQRPTPNRVITENGDFGSLFVEYESTVPLDDAFRLKFGEEEDVIITSATGSKTYHVQYIDINPTAQFDSIERTVLHMEIIPP